MEMSIKRKLTGILGAVIATAVISSQAHAVSIELFDGVTTVSCADGAAGCDVNPVVGAVTFATTIGSWTVSASTAISYPVHGSIGVAALDLNSVDATSSGGGTLTIKASETGYTGIIVGGSASVVGAVGGTLAPGGTASFSAWLDPATNALFTMTSSLGATGLFSNAGSTALVFGGVTSGSAATSSPFSLTTLGSITHTGAGLTSFDYDVTSVPEPATLLLLGSGLVGMGWFGRKKVKGSADEEA